MIELRGVTKTFATRFGDVPALRGIDLSIERGEIFGIAGRSGAGKSTLLRCINLLERPSAGTVEVAGLELTALSEERLRAARRRIGMIFQHFNLLAQRSVFGNVALPLELAGAEKGTIAEKVAPLLSFVGLETMAGRYPAQLSGGQKQRVGIARALASEPDVVLCDEPTSALDPHTTKAILEVLRGVNQRFGVTIVLVTHDLAAIQAVCRRVAVIEAGTIAELGLVAEIFQHPRSPITRALLAAEKTDDLELVG